MQKTPWPNSLVFVMWHCSIVYPTVNLVRSPYYYRHWLDAWLVGSCCGSALAWPGPTWDPVIIRQRFFCAIGRPATWTCSVGFELLLVVTLYPAGSIKPHCIKLHNTTFNDIIVLCKIGEMHVHSANINNDYHVHIVCTDYGKGSK